MATAHEIRTRMMELQTARTEAIEPLVEVQERRGKLLEQLAALDAPYAEAYAQARAGGWGVEELRTLDAEEPPAQRKRSARSGARGRRGAAQDGGAGTGKTSVPAQDAGAGAEPVEAGAQSG